MQPPPTVVPDAVDISVLMEELKDPDPMVSHTAARALAGAGIAAVPALMEALQNDDQQLRLMAAKSLVYMRRGAEPAVPLLITALNDQDSDVRTEAASALLNVKGPSIYKLLGLVNMLWNSDAKTRKWAAERLGDTDWHAYADIVVPSLVRILHDTDEGVCASAAQSLKTIDPDAAAQEGID